MKRIGVLGGMSAQATMDFEARVHRAAQRLVPQLVDFLAIPCNAAHVGLAAIREAAGCPVLSMIDVAVDEVVRRKCRRVGVLGAMGAPPPYLDALRRHDVEAERIDAALQQRLDAGIRAVMEGVDGKPEIEAARAAVATLRARAVEAVVLGCTEIPLLLGDESDAADLISPAALLAEAAVRFAIA